MQMNKYMGEQMYKINVFGLAISQMCRIIVIPSSPTFRLE